MAEQQRPRAVEELVTAVRAEIAACRRDSSEGSEKVVLHGGRRVSGGDRAEYRGTAAAAAAAPRPVPVVGAAAAVPGPVPTTDRPAPGVEINGRVYLNVPFAEKDEAKRELRAEWDKEHKLWWVTPNKRDAAHRWLPPAT